MLFGLFGNKFMNKMEEIGSGSAMADAAGKVMKKKDKFTPEELILIGKVHDEHIADQTITHSFESIVSAVNAIWKYCKVDTVPRVVLCDSPIACKKQAVADGYTTKGKDSDPKNLTEYWSIWYVGYLAMYDFGKRVGLDIDTDKFELFQNWVQSVPFCIFNESVIYVSRKPVKLHFNDQQQLHCETGKSCEFADGWGIWTINGTSVDEQIVMKPETQTLEQIEAETDEERKAIRLQRWHSKVSN